jgi:hypothetical protein
MSDDDSVVVLFKGGRLPAWHDLAPETRDAYEQEHIDLMLAVAREHGLRRIEGFRLITAQGPWVRYWVIEFPTMAGAEAWIDAEIRPPYGPFGYYEYELARPHQVELLRSWVSRPRPVVTPVAEPSRRPELTVRRDSIVILLFGRWHPGSELVDPMTRGDEEHNELMQRVAREHGLMRIEAFRLLGPKADYHRAWVIEFPTLEDAEAWLEAEVLPPHGRYSSKTYFLARPWAPDYFASWVPRRG